MSCASAAVLPWWVERALLVIGGVWFVNLVNFMDGIDWMTVAEVVPVTAALALMGALGALPPQGLVAALALCGAMIGFAVQPAGGAYFSSAMSAACRSGCCSAGSSCCSPAAAISPRRCCCRSTISPTPPSPRRRLIRGEPVWQAHRTHFYQRATDGGFSVTEVVARVFLGNVILGALAIGTVMAPSRLGNIIALLLGAVLVAWLLVVFARGKK